MGATNITRTLIIGAGRRHEPGAVHHDVQNLPGIDFACDFWELPHFVDPESFDTIKATHFLEHLPMAQTKEALLLMRALLRPGGKLYLEVPNFHWHAQEIIKNPSNRQIINYALGGQLNEWDFHYNGFTPEILTDDLIEANFKLLELKPNSSIEAWAEAVEW